MDSSSTISAVELAKLEEAYKKIRNESQNNSIMAKNLTPELFEKLKNRITPKYGASLLDVISAGVNKPNLLTGLLAADADCYETFAPFMTNVVKDRHYIDRSTDLS
ncbi:MAG: hypothetical protein MHPSP_003754, partial [Paramarteilia canceri]